MTTWISTNTNATTSTNWTLTFPPLPAYAPPAKPEPEGPLAWLDREIERTCALARSA